MADLDEPLVTIENERTGERISNDTGLIAYSLDASFETPCDEFEVTIYDDADPRDLRRRWMPLDNVRIFVDDNVQLLGKIDETEGSGESSAELLLRGRDYLSDLVDGDADPTVRLTKQMDLGDALLEYARPFGYLGFLDSYNDRRNVVTGKNPHSGPPGKSFRNLKLEDFKGGPDQGAFETMNRIAARHSLTIQPTVDRRTLALIAPTYEQDPLYKLQRPGNIKRGHARRNWADVPTLTIATGRGASSGAKVARLRSEYPTFGDEAPTPRNAEIDRIALTEIRGAPRCVLFRPSKDIPFPSQNGFVYRPFYLEDKEARNQEQLDSIARRKLGDRLRRTLTYTCTMRGHTDPETGATYAIDTVAEVFDANEDVQENMWVMARRFSNSGGAPETVMELIRLGSWVL